MDYLVSRKVRVVGTLTTMPDRYERLERTLQYINNQTYKLDAIYLSLPKESARLGIPYPKLPKSILKLCTVVECDDYGPITKIVGGLLSETDENTVIITFDDDIMYPSNMVEALMSKHKMYPNMAIGSSGMLLKYPCPMCAISPNQNDMIFSISKFPVPIEGRKVDSIYGYPGALYLRGFFPSINKVCKRNPQAYSERRGPIPSNISKEEDDSLCDFLDYATLSHDMLMNDDIVISGWLSLKGVERRIFPGMPNVEFLKDVDGKVIKTGNEISYNLDAFFRRLNNCIQTCKDLGMYAEVEEIQSSETVVSIGITIAVVLIAMGLGAWYLFKYGITLPFK